MTIVAKFYKSKDSFSCIFNPSIKITAAQVNDDYCDCPDGSDEPGTSACSYLSPLSPRSPIDAPTQNVNTSLALPGFYCKNKGHQPSYVPFTNVNDGVCDYELCCDGSDEWDRIGGVSCADKCKDIGKEWRKQDEARQKSMAAALKKKKELITEAARLQKEVEDRIETLKVELEGQTVKVKALEVQLAEVERRERGRVVRGASKAGKVAILAGLAKTRIQELRDGLMEVRTQRDTGREKIKQLEQILSTFKAEYNPNFNDEGVKRAVRSWEEYAASGDKAEEDEDSDFEKDLDEVSKEDSETEGINWAEWETTEEEDEIDLSERAFFLPPHLTFYSLSSLSP